MAGSHPQHLYYFLSAAAQRGCQSLQIPTQDGACARYAEQCGLGAPVRPVGLIVSCFRPSDDATTLQFLVPSNFFAVTSLRKAAEILETVNRETALAADCRALADEVEMALKRYATYNHPEFGTIYAFEVDGFGNHLLMDDANVPSLLAMPYLGDCRCQ